jgi:hypothetical protein
VRGDDATLIKEHEAAASALDNVEPSADVDEETDQLYAGLVRPRPAGESVRSG